MQTGGLPSQEVRGRWRTLERGTLIWEADQVKGDDGRWHEMMPAPFARDIAALGVAFWEDVTHADGAMLKYTQFVTRIGLKNEGGADDRVRKLYHNLKAHAHAMQGTASWRAWTQQRTRQSAEGGAGYEPPAPHVRSYEEVVAVRGWRHATRMAVQGGTWRG